MVTSLFVVKLSEFLIAGAWEGLFGFLTGLGLAWVPLGELSEILESSELLRRIHFSDRQCIARRRLTPGRDLTLFFVLRRRSEPHEFLHQARCKWHTNAR